MNQTVKSVVIALILGLAAFFIAFVAIPAAICIPEPLSTTGCGGGGSPALLYGIVKEEGTGVRLEGVVITASSEYGVFLAKTDADGIYYLPLPVVDHTWNVLAKKDGYRDGAAIIKVGANTYQAFWLKNLTPPPPPPPGPVTVHVTVKGYTTGIGTPISGATVRIWDNFAPVNTLLEGKTNSDGKVDFQVENGHHYTVNASADGYISHELGVYTNGDVSMEFNLKSTEAGLDIVPILIGLAVGISAFVLLRRRER